MSFFLFVSPFDTFKLYDCNGLCLCLHHHHQGRQGAESPFMSMAKGGAKLSTVVRCGVVLLEDLMM